MARKWQKTAIFSWIFDLFLTCSMECGHIYVPNGVFWGSTGRPHIGDVVMSLFFALVSTSWLINGPFWTKTGQTWQACQRSKVVQKGPKQSTYVFLIIWDPFWAHLDPVGPFQTTNIFLPQMDKVGFCSGASEQKINSCLKWSKRVQMGPKGSQRVKNT